MLKVITIVLLLDIFALCQGCPVGWLQFHGKCYLFEKGYDTWAGAESICTALHSKLVEPRTTDAISFISGELHQLNHHGVINYWIGIHDLAVENRWQYVSDDTLVNVTNWGPTEPNGNYHENCAAAALGYRWKWIDMSCNLHAHFICEKDDPSLQMDKPAEIKYFKIN